MFISMGVQNIISDTHHDDIKYYWKKIHHLTEIYIWTKIHFVNHSVDIRECLYTMDQLLP